MGARRILAASLVLAASASVFPRPAVAQPVGFSPCVGGDAAGYPCDDVDLLSFLPVDAIGGGSRVADVWGWRDRRTGREYAIVTRATGTAFVDVTEPTAPVYVGDLPVQGSPTAIRDVKVYRHVALVSGEAEDAGLQLFDLRRLRRVGDGLPVRLETTASYFGVGDVHNIAVDEESGFAYLVGATACAGFHVLDLADPLAPAFAGCYTRAGSSHDAQCVVYRGPDERYRGRQICFGSNQDRLAVVDFTDKERPRTLAEATYEGMGFVHQGWLTEDHAFFLLDDETDESSFDHGTRTYVFDVSDLEAPRLTGFHESASRATDHNQYVVGDHVFQANYTAGLRVLRFDDLARARLSEVASFDTVPGEDVPGFRGAWSVYPFFPSGTLLVSSIEEGLFVLGWRGFDGDGACPWESGHAHYCRDCGPCAAGDGDCDRDADCGGDLVCASDAGAAFGFGPGIDVCTAGGGDDGCPWPSGHARYCRDCGPCREGEGDCDRDADCGAGLVCVADVGAEHGFGPSIDVCR